MSKVLCIGDVHLKPVIFDKADKILQSGQADFAVQLGDLVDDWGEEFNIALYSRTMQRAVKFHKDHPDTLWVMGNHDYGYYCPHMGVRETGHSQLAEGEMRTWLDEMGRIGATHRILHIVDNCIFTHAGLTQEWLDRQAQLLSWKFTELDETKDVLKIVNGASSEELWLENSPIWARPQLDDYEMWRPMSLQVVGHTPVETIEQDGGVLSCDTHSTYNNGAPIGDRSFAIVDTEKGTWEYAKEEVR